MLSFKLYVLERQSFLLALVEIFGNRGRYANTFFVALFCIRVDREIGRIIFLFAGSRSES